jgi:hypothetical protein
MPFPNADSAVIAEEKICGYLLNLGHPVGGSKAVWFASIGYTMGNWQDLANDLLRLAKTSEDFIAKSSPFGVKYEVSGAIGCPGHRPALVMSVWVVEENDRPRLVTAYPG